MHPQRIVGPAPLNAIGAMLLALVALAGLAPGLLPVEAAAQTWFMVHDRASILDEGQERSAIDDAFRLNRAGVPTQVVIEPLALDQSQANDRAAELRIAHAIESSPGADDGLLVYLSVDPFGNAPTVISFSIGSRTLPAGGLTLGDLETIHETIAIPQLAAGHPARAIVYSLREMIYQHIFTPPPAAPRSARQDQVQGVARLAGPVLAVAVGIWLQPWRRRERSWLPIVTSGIAGIALFSVSVYGRSDAGTVSALAIATLAAWTAIAMDRRDRHDSRRRLNVTPRPPGSRLAHRNLSGKQP